MVDFLIKMYNKVSMEKKRGNFSLRVQSYQDYFYYPKNQIIVIHPNKLGLNLLLLLTIKECTNVTCKEEMINMIAGSG